MALSFFIEYDPLDGLILQSRHHAVTRGQCAELMRQNKMDLELFAVHGVYRLDELVILDDIGSHA
jgi:hypothetical protein